MQSPLCVFIVFILQHCLSASIPEEYEEVEIVVKSVEPTQRSASGRVYTGNDCEYIKLGSITANDGCTDGNKFVIKQVTGVRKQFLILNGEAILGFVTKGKKFASCSSYTEVTANVDCKVVSGLIDVDLASSSSNDTAATTTISSSDDTATTTTTAEETTSDGPTTTASASETTTASASETTTASASELTTSSASETTTLSGCKCGIKRTSRIVGGTETEVNEYPWMAAVANSFESFFCGGTLIASQWVLTAAHCMFKDSQGTQPQTAAELKIVLGEHDIASTSESQIPRKVVTVSQIINHPSYDASTSNNDIALLKLSEEVDLNTYTPSCMPATSDNFEGQKAWVYGWGTTSSGGATSDKLLEVEVPVVSNTVCDAAMGVDITDAMLCAGGELNKDGCQGDSGGPLTVEVSGKHVLIGDVSFGNGCGLAGQYGVYGDVAYFRSWVDSTVSSNGGAKYCPA